MGVWDWVQTGMAIHDPSPTTYKGSYKITVGTGMAGFFGGRHTHLFGPDVRLVVDPEELIGQLFPPWLTALASGLNGSAAFVYGTNTTATYFGPKVDIQRAPKISRISKNFFAHRGVGNQGTWTETQDDPIDVASAVAVGVLSVLAVAVAATFELYMYINYRDFPDPNGGPKHLPILMAIGSYAIPTRLLAFVQWVETRGCYASWAEVSLVGAARQATWDACVALRRAMAARIDQWRAEAARRRLEEARIAAAAAVAPQE